MMKLKFFIVIFWLVTFENVYSQNLKVVDVKHTFLPNEIPLKVSQFISVSSNLMVKEDGYVCLRNTSGWQFILKEGMYNLDSCYKAQLKIHSRYDSVKTLFDIKFPNEKTLAFETQLPLGRNVSDSDIGNEIRFLNGNGMQLIKVCSTCDTITLRWLDQQKDVKSYFIVVEDFFSDRIDYFISSQKSILLDLRMYNYLLNNGEGLIFWCISQDGRKSSRISINRKQE